MLTNNKSQAIDNNEYPLNRESTVTVITAHTTVKKKLASLLIAEGKVNNKSGTAADPTTARKDLADARATLQKAQEQQNKETLSKGGRM